MTLTIDDLIQNLIANNNGKKDELITAIEKSANYGYKVAVDKACEWLKDYAHIYVSETTGDLNEDELINAFRKEIEL